MDKEEAFVQFYDKVETIIDDISKEHYIPERDMQIYLEKIISSAEHYYTNSNNTDHSYYNDKNGKDLFYHFKNGLMGTEMYKGFLVGNIFKYITRHGKKDKSKTIEDLKKARDYLDELIRFESGENDEN